MKIWFSNFTQARQKYCVLARASGTHNVCVCVYYENVKLTLSAIDIKHLSKGADIKLSDHHDCLEEIMCSDRSKYKPEVKNYPSVIKSVNILTRVATSIKLPTLNIYIKFISESLNFKSTQSTCRVTINFRRRKTTFVISLVIGSEHDGLDYDIY